MIYLVMKSHHESTESLFLNEWNEITNLMMIFQKHYKLSNTYLFASVCIYYSRDQTFNHERANQPISY